MDELRIKVYFLIVSKVMFFILYKIYKVVVDDFRLDTKILDSLTGNII